MNEKHTRQQLENTLLGLMQQYSVSKLKIATYNFDLTYERKKDGNVYLTSEKAVIRVLGKVTKVPIGDNEKFSTFEEAEKATKKYWSEYYKKVRSQRTDKQRIAEARRQKRYREKRKAEQQEFKERM